MEMRKQTGMRSLNQLIKFICDKQPLESHVLIESSGFRLNIPIGAKDVMCMKVIEFIRDEYGDHTMGEAIDMLMDTIWWHQTIMIAFPDKGKTARKHDNDPAAVQGAVR